MRNLHNCAEVRAYLEKEYPDWLRALTPRNINAPAEYWLQKVLAVSSVNAAMHNYINIYEHQTRSIRLLPRSKARRLSCCAAMCQPIMFLANSSRFLLFPWRATSFPSFQ